MKILVLSNTPWNDSNSFGNSYSNIFSGIPNLEFANIFCRYGQPDNEFNMKYFQITEKSLIQNLFNKNKPSGYQVFQEKKNATELIGNIKDRYDQARKMRWQIMFWIRDIIWFIGRWKSKQLKAFIDDFKPDIIFQPIYRIGYINNIALFIKKYTKCPMIGYISDDNYTLRQFNLSPLYWIDRIIKREKVKKVINSCDKLYVISDIQKNEYEKIFKIQCKILTKCADFNILPPKWPLPKETIKMIFAGNIGDGRWKSLAIIANALNKLNEDGYQIVMNIYTSTPITDSMNNSLNTKYCKLNKPILPALVKEYQEQSDILVHVEGLSLKYRMLVHQSFSTKLVDYFAMGKCIFAVGTEDEASIAHLLKNDAALIARNKKEIYEILYQICINKKLISEYGEKAYKCGKKFHNSIDIKKMVYQDFNSLIKK